MSEIYTEAMREALASTPDGVVILHTLQISHPALPADLFLVQDQVGHDLTLETGATESFIPAPFRFTLPNINSGGLQELNIAIDNVDQSISDFVEAVDSDPEPVVVRYRTFLNTAKDAPQNGSPLTLFLSDITVNQIEVSGRAAFADIIGRQFLQPVYNVRDFPGLA